MIEKALKFEVSGSRGRPKQMRKKQVENKMKKNGLVKEDACDRIKWRGVVKTITMTIRNPATLSTGTMYMDSTSDDDGIKFFCSADKSLHNDKIKLLS